MLIHSNGTDARLDILQQGNFAITSSSITAYTAVAGDNLLIDTAAAQVTITLPAHQVWVMKLVLWMYQQLEDLLLTK